LRGADRGGALTAQCRTFILWSLFVKDIVIAHGAYCADFERGREERERRREEKGMEGQGRERTGGKGKETERGRHKGERREGEGGRRKRGREEQRVSRRQREEAGRSKDRPEEFVRFFITNLSALPHMYRRVL